MKGIVLLITPALRLYDVKMKKNWQQKRASQPGFWFGTRENFIQEWVMNQWQMEYCERENLQTEPPHLRRERSEWNLKLISYNVRRGSNFQGKKSVATRTDLCRTMLTAEHCGALHCTFVVARKFRTNKRKTSAGQDHHSHCGLIMTRSEQRTVGLIGW